MYRFEESAVAILPEVVAGNRTGEADPIYTLDLDEAAGIIRAVVHGFWTLAEADAYIADLSLLVARVRARSPRVKVLIDRRFAPIQSTEVAERLGAANSLFQPGDSFAFVVDSYLAKAQLRRLFVLDYSKAFMSLDAAETWLGAV